MVGLLVAPGVVGRLVAVGDAVAGCEVGRLDGKLVGVTATVGSVGGLVCPGSVGATVTAREGWRVGASCLAAVGLLVAIVGLVVGCSEGAAVAATGEGLGLAEGCLEGCLEGWMLGCSDGLFDGVTRGSVGDLVAGCEVGVLLGCVDG